MTSRREGLRSGSAQQIQPTPVTAALPTNNTVPAVPFGKLPAEIIGQATQTAFATQYDRSDLNDFPRVEPIPYNLLGASAVLRRLSLDSTIGQLLWIQVRLIGCYFCPELTTFDASSQLRNYLRYGFDDIDPGRLDLIARNSGRRQDLCRIKINMTCNCNVNPSEKRSIHTACFRAHEIRSLLMCGLMQKLISDLPNIGIEVHVRVTLGATADDWLSDIRRLVRGANHVTLAFTGANTGTHNQQSLNLAMRRTWSIRGRTQAFQYQAARITGLIDGGVPPCFLLAPLFDFIDTHWFDLDEILTEEEYDPQDDGYRDLCGAVGNYYALVIATFAQFLLAQKNDREHQRHYTIPNREFNRIYLNLYKEDYIWDRLLRSLDTADRDAEREIRRGGADFRTNNLEYWIPLKQAKADLRLAFARAALVVGADDQVLEEGGVGADADPMPDIRENSHRSDKVTIPLWATRIEAMRKHRDCAQREHDWLRQWENDASIDVGMRQDLQTWQNRFNSVEPAITRALGVAEANKREDAQRAEDVVRLEKDGADYMQKHGKKRSAKSVRAMARKKRRKEDANRRLRKPMLDIRVPQDMDLLIRWRPVNFVGDLPWLYDHEVAITPT